MPAAGFTSYECYTDESGIGKPHRYMVLGGIISQKWLAQSMNAEIDDFRRKRGFKDGYEFKWRKVDNTNIGRYKDFVSLLADQRSHFHYKSIVIDRQKLDHKRFNAGSAVIGYYKFHYQLMIHCFGKYFKDGDKCFLWIDKAEVAYDLEEYKKILNNGLRSKPGSKIVGDVFRTVEWRDSKKSNHVQAADVLTGGLRLNLNLNYLDGKPDVLTAEKRDLANFILSKWGISDPFASTSLRKQDFSIWHFKMRP